MIANHILSADEIRRLQGGGRAPHVNNKQRATSNKQPVILQRPDEELNRTERLWRDHLRHRFIAGEVGYFAMHPLKIILADRSTYTPDSLHEEVGSRNAECRNPLIFTEIKGFLRDDALVKFKQAAALCPWAEWQMIRLAKGGIWQVLYCTKGAAV